MPVEYRVLLQTSLSRSLYFVNSAETYFRVIIKFTTFTASPLAIYINPGNAILPVVDYHNIQDLPIHRKVVDAPR
jgi:hypothetical protein